MKPAILSDFIGRLFEIGLLAQSNALSTQKYPGGDIMIEVGDTSQTSSFSQEYENSLSHYVDMFSEGKYSIIMFDGSLLSIKYIIDAQTKSVKWQRFLYFPAISRIDVLAGDGPGELPSPSEYIRVPRQASLRFEYAPEDAGENHPASHLHLNSMDCRVPVASRLGVAEFLHFVVDNFYPEFRERYLSVIPAQLNYRDDLSDESRRRFRVATPSLQVN